MPKHPDKDVSVARRDFFRQLFVKAVEKVEDVGREFAKRVTPPQPPPVYEAPSYSGWTPPVREKYGPPWPLPYGPPVPGFLKEKLKADQRRSVVYDPAEDHPDMT